MKQTKKLMALVIAMVMMVAMGVTVFAAGDKKITLTGGKAGHTYTLYQIFTGTYDATSGELKNLQWGDDANAAYKAAYATAAAAALEIHDVNDARATAQQLVANSYLGDGTGNTLTADGDVVFENLDEGYYVIIDTNGNTTPVEGDYSSAYIVQVVKDVNGAIKGSGVTSDKEVLDSTGTAATSDAAAYNIGDAVPFNLKATTADNAANYRQYHITFQDKLSNGLTAPDSYTVTVLGKTFTVPATGNDPAAQTTENGTVITVTKVTPETDYSFAIKVEFTQENPTRVDQEITSYLNGEVNSKLIVVSYSATLNDNAVVGLPGNDNDFHVTYSNNPEDADGGDEGKTPEDKVKVFTYKTVIDKVDPEGTPLNGAGFTIYQEVPAGTEGAQTGAAIKTALGSTINATALVDAKYYVAKGMTTVSGNNAQFEFKGLADGTYVLVETTIPTGFNAFNSVQFTISSEVTDTGITTLTGTDPFNTTNKGENGAVTATKKDGSTHSLNSGELYAEIENNSGNTLPSTGGIGTTIFYVIGAILVIGAGILLVTRRRMSAN